MSEILSLFQYHRVNPTTWVYLSSLLAIGLFFKFNRFWSIRNLDLILVLLLGPGLLLANFGLQIKVAAEAKVAAEEAPLPTPTELAVPSTESEAATTPTDEEPEDVPLTTADDELASDDESEGEPIEEPEAELTPAEKELRQAKKIEKAGYVWLFFVGAMLLVRLLADPTMVRRPLLEPNLTVGGLTFSCCALFMFLMANVITSTPIANENPTKFGPGYRLLYSIPQVPVINVADGPAVEDEDSNQVAFGVAAKVMAILGHLAIVVGVVMTGYRHFDNIRTGIGAATLYLLLPYTAQMTGRVDHVVPAALLVWAVYFYRRPLTAGIFVGLAGIVYYPLFLLPLWISFYWQRGKMRFVTGVAIALGGLVLGLIPIYLRSGNLDDALIEMFALHLPVVKGTAVRGLAGIWNYYDPIYRLPFLAAFIALSLSFVLWPAQKNLGTLMCCSAAIMLAAQFWHRFNGGTCMAWYVPLLLLTIFRPNLEDRVALAVLGEGWFPRRRGRARAAERAA